MRIPFAKMNGLGNDFVMIDARDNAVTLSAAAAKAIANRANGPGCDQIVIVEPSSLADVFMRILNADGSESGACGNAMRCLPLFAGANSAYGSPLTIETASGVSVAEMHRGDVVSVDMGEPKLDWHQIPLSQALADTSHGNLTFEAGDGRILGDPGFVNMGNPHCIFWVRDPESFDLAAFGPSLERHPLFPERANISLAEAISRSVIALRVWERGAGLTQACGTAACAALVAGVRTGRTERIADVTLPGGSLRIEWRPDNHVIMTGPAAFDYNGVLDLGEDGELLSFQTAPS